MFIEELILDGFKSYATRTVISGFDANFNAITGLNGTGKSNILDAICFVLGISNLSQVRVSNLQELVYKQGQAGVTKATVTIVFNNKDKSASPPSYEEFEQITVSRQIVIGGKNKYMINGHVAQLQKVQNLFHSVQLNVNNPHFLIMQGRITKVLNMKPPEILGMIEEAAGTRMYEKKKNDAEKIMEKKDKKVDEINQVLADEIEPTLSKLRSERKSYVEWSASNTEAERLARLLTAFDYSEKQKLLARASQQTGELQSKSQTLLAEHQSMKEDKKVWEGELAQLQKSRSAELAQVLAGAEGEVETLSKRLVLANTQWTNAAEARKSEESNMATLKGLLAKRRQEWEQQKSQQAGKEAELAQEELHLSALQDKLDLANAALTGGADGQTLSEKINGLQAQVASKNAGVAQLQSQGASLTREMEQLEVKQQLAKKKEEAEWQRIAGLEAEIAGLEGEGTQAALASLGEKRRLLQHATNKLPGLREKVDVLSAKCAGLSFDFTDPHPGFDRSKQVKGLVAELISVADPGNYTALEVAAGNKLFQVVVDSEETGKALLSGGKLKRRVTLIPLNRIAGRVLDPAVIAKATQVAGGSGKVATALSLIGYEHEVEAAMKYVFGSTFVCADMETARTVTFHPDIRATSVTKEGDVTDPAGTLTGGSFSKGGLASILARLADLQEAKSALAMMEAQVAGLEEELQAASGAEKRMARLERLRKEVARGKEQLQRTNDKWEETLRQKQHALADLKRQEEIGSLEVKGLSQRCSQLEAQAKQSRGKGGVAVGLKPLTAAQLTALKDTIGKKENIVATLKGEVMRLRAEGMNLQMELSKIEADVEEASSTTLAESLREEQYRQSEMQAAKRDYEEKQGELQARRLEMTESDTEMKGLKSKLAQLSRALTENELQRDKLEHQLARFTKELAEAQSTVKSLRSAHPWIAGEESFFGRPKSDYDFAALDMKQCRQKLAAAKQQQEMLGRKINKKVMGMFEQAEHEFKTLMEKKTIILKDKEKIQQVIAELDVKKNETLRRTWKKVNGDFGSIFSTLLPNAFAKLEPPAGGTVLDGLEVKVAFGDAWKEGLTELSGGQRSLLALSLILAMLLFKPAPMYILDEVDAALDLSHTQNIGHMLRKHFMNSQFIVVSLKEGMFNHANVVFRTRFVDGLSVVVRTVNSPDSHREKAGEQKMLQENAANAVGGKRARTGRVPGKEIGNL